MKALLLVLSLLPFIGSAQQATPKVKELGLGFTNLTGGYSLEYRWGNEKRLYRITGGLTTSGSNTDQTSTQNNLSDSLYHVTSTSKHNSPVFSNFNLNVTLSKLFLVPLNDRAGWYWGGNLGLSLGRSHTKREVTTQITDITGVNSNYTNTQTNNTSSMKPFVGISFGGYYQLTKFIRLYAEVSPNIYLSLSNSKVTGNLSGASNNNESTSNNNSIGLSGLSNSSARLSLVYRFSK